MPAGSVDGYIFKSNANGVASWAEDQVNDADANANNEEPLAGNGINIDGSTQRRVNINTSACNDPLEHLIRTGTQFEVKPGLG
jgi:hypothetical protein